MKVAIVKKDSNSILHTYESDTINYGQFGFPFNDPNIVTHIPYDEEMNVDVSCLKISTIKTIPDQWTKGGQTVTEQPILTSDIWIKDGQIVTEQPMTQEYWSKEGEENQYTQPMTQEYWSKDGEEDQYTQPMTQEYWIKDGESPVYEDPNDESWTHVPSEPDTSWTYHESVPDTSWTHHESVPDTSWTYYESGSPDPTWTFVPEHTVTCEPYITINNDNLIEWKKSQNIAARDAFYRQKDEEAEEQIRQLKLNTFGQEIDDTTILMLAMGYMDISMNIDGNRTPEEINEAKTALITFRSLRDQIQQIRAARDAAKQDFTPIYNDINPLY